MALVLGVASTKGGSGKTTLAINLARAIQLKGHDIQIIDTDPHRTASRWGGFNRKAISCRFVTSTMPQRPSPSGVA